MSYGIVPSTFCGAVSHLSIILVGPSRHRPHGPSFVQLAERGQPA